MGGYDASGEIDVFADVAVGVVGRSPGGCALFYEQEPPYPACALEALAEVESPDVVFGVGAGEDVIFVDEVPSVVEVAGVFDRRSAVEDLFAHSAALAVEGVLDGEVAFVDADHAVLAVPFEGGAFAVVGEVSVEVVQGISHRGHKSHRGVLVQGIREVAQRIGLVGSGNGDAVSNLVEVVAGVSVAHGGGGDF